ncbi:MAG: Ig-like domain-containing protein [Tissierellaceae bacterium]|nr:Ig-like domain-containing protein [Tissierellaceae bacterium]
MKLLQKIISIIVVFILILSENVFILSNVLKQNVHAISEESKISYDNFYNTEGLQINGLDLIKDGAIQFENSAGVGGESIFSQDKILLGNDLSFSTSFSFKNRTQELNENTVGGFIFTLQSSENTLVSNDFNDSLFYNNFSIGFKSKYSGGPISAKAINNNAILVAAINDFKLSSIPYANLDIYYSPYINELSEELLYGNIVSPNVDTDYFKVWIGYDGAKQELEALILNDRGDYKHIVEYVNLSKFLEHEVYAGFMGSMGDAGDMNEISEWYFRSDTSLLDDALIELDASELVSQMDMSETPKKINYDLNLYYEGAYGSSISWKSNNTEVIGENGAVYTPGVNDEPIDVTLTAFLRKGNSTREIEFKFRVCASDMDIINSDYDLLTDEVIRGTNHSNERIFSDLVLPSEGNYGSSIIWSSSNPQYIGNDGKVNNPSLVDGDQNVTLTAFIEKGNSSRQKEFYFTVIAELTDIDTIIADIAWLDSVILGENTNFINITSDLNLYYEGVNGSKISWESTAPDIINTYGTVTRPAYKEKDVEVSLTATFNYKDETTSKDYFFMVKAMEQSDEGKVQDDLAWLDEGKILNDNIDLDNVTGNLYLRTEGENGSLISWESTDRTVVDLNGTVYRPKFPDVDKTVTLTATVSSGSVTRYKTFEVIVKAWEATNAERVHYDYDWLDEVILKDNTDLNNIMTDLFLPTEGLHKSVISWESSNPNVIDTNGKVNRTSFLEGSSSITLIATLRYGDYSNTKFFSLKVKANEQTVEGKVREAYEWLDEWIVLADNTDLSNITTDLSLIKEGINGCTISWESSNPIVIDTNGKVKRPIFVDGDQTVELNATLALEGYELTKTFIVIVKVGYYSPELTVDLDFNHLDQYKIINENIDLDNVVSDLNLPTRGDHGSYLRWESSDIGVLNIDGRVNRPKFTEEEKVVDLTVYISFSTVEKSKIFSVVVKPEEGTNDEIIESDSLWIDKVILAENSGFNNIMTDLNLSTKGKYGSNIEWYSSYPEFISIDGKVTRPSYIQGDTESFSLVATITKGDKNIVRTYLVKVKKSPLETSDLLNNDLMWLNLMRFSFLCNNESEFSVTDDLFFPDYTLENGSTVIWESDSPEIISITGEVNRPKTGEGNKLVKITATLTLDSESVKYDFMYTVLEIPEGDPPRVISTTPENNSKDVSWDTKEVVIEFDENIDNGTVVLLFNNRNVIGDISGKTLKFSPDKFLSTGENIVFIPSGIVKDKYGNPNVEYEFSFTMDEKVNKIINIISSSPANLSTNLPSTSAAISLKFDESNLIKGENFYNISLKSKNYIPHENGVSFETYLDKDLLNIKIKDKLNYGTVYELAIPQGALTDQYKNKNKENILQFRTSGLSDTPSIKSIYPYNNQFNVSINQDIEVVFSSPQVLNSNLLVLRDNTGKVYTDLKLRNPIYGDTTKYTISAALEPIKNYTLSGPYKMEGSSELGFELNFRTGNNTLPIAKTYPSVNSSDYAINEDIIIEFDSDSALVKSGKYVNNTIIDSNGEPVIFREKEEGNKVILSPLDDLEPGMMYTVHIPAGKYQSVNNAAENDEYRFSFYTAKPIEVDLSLINTPNMWFIDKDLEIDGSSLEKYFLRNRRSIVSFEWDLGDGTVINTKKFTHRYYSEEYYRIILKIKDDKGFEYELEDYISIEPISQVDMSVMVTDKTNTIQDALVMYFKINLEQNGQPIPGEKIRVELFKNGGLQWSYNIEDTNNNSNYRYTFVEQKGLYAGVYELVFTYDSHGEITVVKEYINIPEKPILYPFILNISDSSTGKLFSDSNILYVKLNGERYPAFRNEGDYPSYTVKNNEGNIIMLQHGVRYFIELEGWKISTQSFSITKPVNFLGVSGYPIVPMSKDKAEIVNVSIELPLDHPMNNVYIEGAKISKADVKIQGMWNDLTPGYYEMKTENGDIYKTFKSDTFKINPSETLKYGNKLMFRMVSDNGITSTWKYADIIVAPQPTINGKKLNVNVVNREYRLSFPTVFDGVVGGVIDILKDIPLIDSGNFGIGGGIPAFSGPVYPYFYDGLQSNMDFEAGFKYDTNKKQTKDTKIEKVKKVTSVGYSFDFNIEGDLMINYREIDDNWDLRYAYVLMSGSASRKQSSGYKLFGVIGIEAYLTMGVRASGALDIRDTGLNTDYSGNVSLTPVIGGGASGNYGLGEIGGFIEASLPVTMYFPSNIIDVEANIEAKIENVFVGHKEVLLNKKYNAFKWSNRSKGLMRTLLEDEDAQYFEITLLPRDYIGRASNWVANENAYDMGMRRLSISSESNLNRNTLIENIYPYTNLQLVENNNEKWLVWVDDNPKRDAINRTELRYTVLQNGEWSKISQINDDGTADFAPTVATMGNGVLMAWQNIGKVIEGEELKNSLYNSEISVTQDVYSQTNIKSEIITLTNDDKVDHSPKIASNNEKAILVWTKSEGLSFSLNRDNELLAPKNTDSLYFSRWDDGNWSVPQEIEGGLPTVVDSNLYMNDRDGLLLYTLDMDNDFSTMEDREIFARIYDSGLWQEAVQITNNNLVDSNPQAVYLNNQWFITWIQDGNIKYMDSLHGSEKEPEFTKNIQNNYQLVLGKDLVALVYRTINENGEQQIGASFYDVYNKTWGDTVILTESGSYSHVFNATFTDKGELSVVYTEAKLINEAVPYGIDGEQYLIEEINISDKVDLKILDYTPINDLSISDKDILLSSDIPIPGTMATAYVNINNKGDFAEKALVELYDGDPDLGGRKLGEYNTIDYIPARSSMEVSIDWIVDTRDEPSYDLYVKVSSMNPENNYDNNTASIKIQTTDLAILDIQSKHSFKEYYSIEALVKNNGATKLYDMQLKLKDESGKIIGTKDIEFLDILESQYIIFTISSEGLPKNDSGEITIYAELISPTMEEANHENNIFEFTIIPDQLLVDNINISQGERSVDTKEIISVGFNMDIDKGRNFDDIVLADDYLNIVSIEKDIEGSVLTITPLNSLDYGTNYNLTMPNEALKDSFNNVTNGEYRLSFTTIGTNPDIIFAYPGNNMEDVDISSNIRLKFNQKVQEGSSFSYIALYDNNSKEVLIRKALEDHVLTISAIGNLSENTTYTLEVPNRAIQNENGEILNNNYTLNFRTGLFEESPEEPGDPIDPINPNEPDYPGEIRYSITTVINRVKKQININIVNREAIIDLSHYASSIFTSGENIVLDSPIIPNVNSYRILVPSNFLVSEDNNSTLTLNTSIGSITISSGMLRGMDVANNGNVEIILATGDKSKLTNEAKLIVGKYPIIHISILVNGERIDYVNSNNPLKLSIPYKPTVKELNNLESIIAWDIGTKETIIPNGYYNKTNSMVIFTTNKLNYYSVGYNPVRFNDVNINDWYEKAVNYIAARNITTGTGDGNYSPNSKLTRGQFIVLLMRAYGITPNENPINNFSDAGNVYYTGYISKAKELGISKGIGNNLFAPENEITRQEMFTMLYNTLNIIGSEVRENNGMRISDFSDSSDVATWAKEPISILMRNKIINGSNGMLNPTNITTRAEMAQVLYNLLFNE